MSPISPKQVAFIERLRAERGLEPLADVEALTIQAASQVIDALLKTPRPEREPVEVAPLTPGVYETTEGVFVVKPNRDKTRLYAKLLVESAPRMTDEGEVVDFDFEYARGAIYRLTEADRMPLEKAKQLTIRYGRCINCGRKLKAAKSVEAGIGPVCIKSFAA